MLQALQLERRLLGMAISESCRGGGGSPGGIWGKTNRKVRCKSTNWVGKVRRGVHLHDCHRATKRCRQVGIEITPDGTDRIERAQIGGLPRAERRKVLTSMAIKQGYVWSKEQRSRE